MNKGMNKHHTEIDLNINNYELNDILNLFNIPIHFDEADLKHAKSIVLKTHPDISKLPSKYFLFYSKAYKMIYSLWEFRKKGDVNKTGKNTDYVQFTDMEEKNELLNQFFHENTSLKKKGNFNAWFNEHFEKNKIVSEKEGKGYDTWLRSEDMNASENKNVTMATMAEEIDKKKREIRSLIVHQDIQECWFHGNTGSDLSHDAPATYDSDMFSALSYQDLQKAHTESVIPVTQEDYENKVKFNSVNEFIRHRDRQDMKPLSEQQALQYLQNRNTYDEETSVRRAYHLAKQTELATKKQNEFWSNIQMIKDR